MQEDRKAWFYAAGIMLVIALTVFTLRLVSIVLFTLEFEVALVYVPTIVLIAISTYLMKADGRSPT